MNVVLWRMRVGARLGLTVCALGVRVYILSTAAAADLHTLDAPFPCRYGSVPCGKFKRGIDRCNNVLWAYFPLQSCCADDRHFWQWPNMGEEAKRHDVLMLFKGLSYPMFALPPPPTHPCPLVSRTQSFCPLCPHHSAPPPPKYTRSAHANAHAHAHTQPLPLQVGRMSMPAGRTGEAPAVGLTEALVGLGFETDRLKTGTPARVDKRSVDFSGLEEQPGG